uniref:Large ribosomal subunit protein uL5 n=1 Tax=candidate division CPR3 bacterium TaxID=2268181 RepID=A0A7C4R8J4_UNCC3
MSKETNQPRMKEKYEKEIIPAMLKEFDLKNKMSIPAISKIAVNVGIGRIAAKDSNAINQVVQNIAKITGQKPVVVKSKKSVAGFKLREGMPVGVSVTLRGRRMYEFLDKLISIALPRVRDFRGLNIKSFDNQGNYSVGIKEHTIFPEIEIESLEQVHGMQVNISLNKKDKKMGIALLKNFGFPFKE